MWTLNFSGEEMQEIDNFGSVASYLPPEIYKIHTGIVKSELLNIFNIRTLLHI